MLRFVVLLLLLLSSKPLLATEACECLNGTRPNVLEKGLCNIFTQLLPAIQSGASQLTREYKSPTELELYLNIYRKNYHKDKAGCVDKKPYKNRYHRAYINKYRQWIDEASLSFNLSPTVLTCVLFQESHFNKNARTGTMLGLGQMRKKTIALTDRSIYRQGLKKRPKWLENKPFERHYERWKLHTEKYKLSLRLGYPTKMFSDPKRAIGVSALYFDQTRWRVARALFKRHDLVLSKENDLEYNLLNYIGYNIGPSGLKRLINKMPKKKPISVRDVINWVQRNISGKAKRKEIANSLIGIESCLLPGNFTSKPQRGGAEREKMCAPND